MNEPRPSIRYCRRDGRSIAWTAIGHGPPLVYAAIVNSLETFVRTPLWSLVHLAGCGRTIVLYDGLGSGLSDRDAVEISVEAAVADLSTVAEAAGLARFSIVAGILGAQPAIAYAARHPDRVERLVSVGGMARGLHRRNPSAIELARREALLAAIRAGRDDRTSVFGRVNVRDCHRGASDDELHAMDRWWDRVVDSEAEIRLIDAQSRADVTDDARRVACPALVVHSLRDPRIPFDEGRRLASLLPDADFQPFEGGTNWPMPSDRGFPAVVERIGRFLERGGPARLVDDFASGLTPREREVLELIASGLDNLQIAARLGVAEKTVRNHITPIFSKLSVENRSQAIVRAREAGLGGAIR